MRICQIMGQKTDLVVEVDVLDRHPGPRRPGRRLAAHQRRPLTWNQGREMMSLLRKRLSPSWPVLGDGPADRLNQQQNVRSSTVQFDAPAAPS